MKLYLPIGDNVLGENVYNIVGRELSVANVLCQNMESFYSKCI